MTVRNKKTRTKKVMATFLVVTLLLVGSIMFFTLNDTAVQAHASSNGLSANTYATLQQRMASNVFVHDGNTFHIDQYYSHLFGNHGRSANSPRVRLPSASDGHIETAEFRVTDPITSLIPVAVFQELTTTGVRTFMGLEWGVIIDVQVQANWRNFWVQVIDIRAVNNVDLLQGQSFSLEIRPLFEVHLAWIAVNSGIIFANIPFNRIGPVGLYAIPRMGQRFVAGDNLTWGYFAQSSRNHITNVAFTGLLNNEQNVNPGDTGFSFDNDFGHYFFGTDLHFSGVDANDLISPRIRSVGESVDALATFNTFAGIAAMLDPTGILGYTLVGMELISIARSLNPDSRILPPEHHFNVQSSHYQRFWPTRGLQLSRHGRLMKDATTLPAGEVALSLRSSYSPYARGVFMITQDYDQNGNLWISRLDVGFSFDVRRFGNMEVVATAEGVRTEILGIGALQFTSLGNGQALVRLSNNFPYIPPRINIPERVFLGGAEYIVTQIGAGAFQNVSNVMNLTIPSAVTFIGSNAFLGANAHLIFAEGRTQIQEGLLQNQSGVMTANIPTTVQTIGARAFYGSGLTGVSIPNNVRYVGAGAFERNLSMTSITFGSAVMMGLGARAFYGNINVASVTVPVGLATIGGAAFGGWTDSQVIVVDGRAGPSTGFGSGWSGGARVIFRFGTDGDMIIIGGMLVSYSGASDFVDIPNSVTRIAADAFGANPHIRQIFVPHTVTRIYGNPFGQLTGLERVIVHTDNPNYSDPGGVVIRTGDAESEILHIPHRIRSVNNTVIIPDGITRIPSDAFLNRNTVRRVILPDSVRYIESMAFGWAQNLNEINLPYGLVYIGEFGFWATSITRLVVPRSVEYIGANGLTSGRVTLEGRYRVPSEWSSDWLGTGWIAGREFFFDYNGFYFNSWGTMIGYFGQESKVEIPAGVTFLPQTVFANLRGVEQITVRSNSIFIMDNSFGYWQTIFVPDMYYAPVNWMDNWSGGATVVWMERPLLIFTRTQGDYYSVSMGVVEIDGRVYIPSHHNGVPVREIADGGFDGAAGLKEVVIQGHYLRRIGDRAFRGTSIETVRLPMSLVSIGREAFRGANIADSVIPVSVSHIGEDAFYDTVFWNNTMLWDNWFNNGMVRMGTVGAQSFVIGNSWILGINGRSSGAVDIRSDNVADGAFRGQDRLTSIRIGRARYIGENAFAGINWVSINVDLPSQPRTWHRNWNPNSRPVTWAEQTIITTQEELATMLTHSAANFRLGADIELVGQWTPIEGFRGELDGDGHTIRGLRINRPGQTLNGYLNLGLFASLGGIVRNLNIYRPVLSVESNHGGAGLLRAGVLAGASYGVIENVRIMMYSIGVNRCHSQVGGMVGFNRGRIYGSELRHGTVSGNGDLGGFAGFNYWNGRIAGNTALDANIWHWSVHTTRSVGIIAGWQRRGGIYDNFVSSSGITTNGPNPPPTAGAILGVHDDRHGAEWQAYAFGNSISAINPVVLNGVPLPQLIGGLLTHYGIVST